MKMKKTKWALILVIALVFGVLDQTSASRNVSAESGSTVSASLRISVDKNTIVEGEPITVSVYLTGTNLNVWNALFSYDTDVFEKLIPEGDEDGSISGNVRPVFYEDENVGLFYSRGELLSFNDKRMCKITLIPKKTVNQAVIKLTYGEAAGGAAKSCKIDDVVYTIGGSDGESEESPAPATNHPSLWMAADKNTIDVGNPITVSIYITGQFNLLEATFSYDTNVFDDLIPDNEDEPSVSGNGVTTDLEDQKAYLQYTGSGKQLFHDKCICKIKLVPKKSVEMSTVQLTSVASVSNALEKTTYDDVSYTIGDPNNEVAGTPIPHLYTDYTHATQVTDTSTVIYANGGKVKKGDATINTKAATLYTDILASYHYETDARGKLKASTGKVIAGITGSSVKPELIKGKIVDKEAAKMATASIRHGQITVTAKSITGTAYLWVMDTGDTGIYTCCPITIKPAPSAITLYATPDTDSSFSAVTTKKYTKADIKVSEATDVYVYPVYKMNGTNTKIEALTFSTSVDAKAADYFTVTQSASDPYCFTIKATGLKDGKAVSGKVTLTCDQSGKKVNFTAKAVP